MRIKDRTQIIMALCMGFTARHKCNLRSFPHVNRLAPEAPHMAAHLRGTPTPVAVALEQPSLPEGVTPKPSTL